MERSVVIGLLIALTIQAALASVMAPESAGASHLPPLWSMFSFGLPIVLCGALLGGRAWAFMGAVMYATVGLALDISTGVYAVTHEHSSGQGLPGIGISAVLNFLVIVFGGRGFLGAIERLRPRADLHPSPPSPPSA